MFIQGVQILERLNYDSTATVSNTSECIYEDDYCVLGENGDLVLRDPDNYCGDCNDPDNSPIYPKGNCRRNYYM